MTHAHMQVWEAELCNLRLFPWLIAGVSIVCCTGLPRVGQLGHSTEIKLKSFKKKANKQLRFSLIGG